MNRIIGSAAAAKAPLAEAPPAASRLVVDEESAGQRLDNFLLRHLKGVPKTHVYRIIRSGEVRLDKGRAAADTRVAAGSVIRVPPLRRPAAPEGAARAAPARDFPVLLEDDALIAIDKPAGVAVHGGSGVDFGVIEQARRARHYGEPGGARFLELVHRLDRETSGVLLIAKRRSALTALQAALRERRMRKTYLALVLGEWPERLKVIDAPLKKFVLPDANGGAGERRVQVAAPGDADAQSAVTLVRVRERFAGFTLLEVTIKTGRTHQIRVHLASAGHPIAGDAKYGDFARNKALERAGLKRMFLHAWRLAFTHPTSGEAVALEAPLAPELLAFQEHCRAV